MYPHTQYCNLIDSSNDSSIISSVVYAAHGALRHVLSRTCLE